MKRFILAFLLASGFASAAGLIKNSDISSSAAISLSKLATISNNSVLGNDTGSAAVPQAMSGTRVTALLNAFTGDSGSGGVKGMVPAPSSGDTAANKFLHANGGWSTISSDHGGLSGLSDDDHAQYLFLNGRSGGQTAYGGTAALNNLVLRSTTNGTVGSVVVASQSGERAQLGPTGSTTYSYNPLHFMVANSNSTQNGFVFHSNESNWPSNPFSAVASPQGIGIYPHDSGGSMAMIWRVPSDIGYLYVRRATDGANDGYMTLGETWGFMNSASNKRTFRVSGTTGQTAELVAFYNQSDFGNQVSAIGAGGQFVGPAGVVGTPAFSTLGDLNNGWWFPAADTQAWSLAGVEKMRLDSTGLKITAGAYTVPNAISASEIDWAVSNVHTKTLGANTTFTFANRVAGQTIVVRLTNTASNYTVAWPTTKWTTGSVPVMSTGATSDIYTFFYDGTDNFGSYVQDLR